MSRLLRCCVACAIILVGCSKQDKPRSNASEVEGLQLDTALVKIAPALAFMELNINLERQANCFISDAVENVKNTKIPDAFDTEKIANKVIQDVRSQFIIKCALYKLVSKQVSPVFQQIKQMNKIPQEAYVFSIFERDGDGYSESKLGLFKSLQSCETLEGSSRDHGFATKKCYHWKKL